MEKVIFYSTTSNIIGRMKTFSTFKPENEQLSTVINYFQIMSNGSFLFGAVLMLVLCAEWVREWERARGRQVKTKYAFCAQFEYTQWVETCMINWIVGRFVFLLGWIVFHRLYDGKRRTRVVLSIKSYK